jgi:methylated-DNA-protein-cysteine methyltransferase-like protein
MLTALRNVPAGRVTTADIIAAYIGSSAAEVVTLLSRLSEDERDACPWHRVVAKGGAIGRGPWRDTHFARLVREGVTVSPAGVVQDLARVLLSDLSTAPAVRDTHAPPTVPGKPRSHGMKDRPGH